MGQISASFSNNTIELMKEHYEKHKEKPPQGAIFRARVNGTVITGYKSGKVLFQGANVENEFAKWEKYEVTPITSSKRNLFSVNNETNFTPPKTLFEQSHIGSDESGTGDYFGPITTCAVYVKAEQIDDLRKMGIQDSKAISDSKVKKLAKQLIDLDIPYSLMVLRNERYNELQRKGWSQSKMKTILHHAVIEKVIEKVNLAPEENKLIDQFCSTDIFKKYLSEEGKSLFQHTYFMTKAEDYSIAVAAASIIARASFLQEMDKLSQLVGCDLIKGASAEVDRLIANIIRVNGQEILPKIAKVHFANTKKAMQYLKK